MKTTNVSSLKNNLSARLKHVVAGEPLLITDRNRAVAMLTPLGKGSMEASLENLAAEGLVRPGGHALEAASFLAMPRACCGKPLSDAILEDREGR